MVATFYLRPVAVAAGVAHDIRDRVIHAFVSINLDV